jgi:hypothetical protein
MTNLSTACLESAPAMPSWRDFDSALVRFGDVFDAAAHGKNQYLSWRSLITGAPPGRRKSAASSRSNPGWISTPWSQGRKPMTGFVPRLAPGLTEAHGVRVRLTGPVPLSTRSSAPSPTGPI